ncbi:uncharacterized protein BYT42DRAFT_573088 [Radiomyces spectabilis]|uniref:uncharacterized protein n=1 Tax=Radiomyces spectabilis TaxID=64574 RepID=UPI00221F4F91|nr:uncharacterized protein BYT42DRAFT_573088 [Radiomyces spectabilis]KAI8376008.1 hypothetical protein BYT42DRAFT_573088 [Radiomyces spectabilis]
MLLPGFLLFFLDVKMFAIKHCPSITCCYGLLSITTRFWINKKLLFSLNISVRLTIWGLGKVLLWVLTRWQVCLPLANLYLLRLCNRKVSKKKRKRLFLCLQKCCFLDLFFFFSSYLCFY